jgi:hypothetical protein
LSFADLSCLWLGLGTAQVKQNLDADHLREKIEQLESIDLTSKSPSVQDIYRRSLLRLYNQYISALEQDIAGLKSIQSVTSGTGSDSQKEITAQVQKLTGDLNVTKEKIQTLTGDLKVTTASEPPAPKIVPQASEKSTEFVKASEAATVRQRSVSTLTDTSDRPVPSYAVSDIPLSDRSVVTSNSSIPAQPSDAKVTVKGTVYVTNKSFYQKADSTCKCNFASTTERRSKIVRLFYKLYCLQHLCL